MDGFAKMVSQAMKIKLSGEETAKLSHFQRCKMLKMIDPKTCVLEQQSGQNGTTFLAFANSAILN